MSFRTSILATVDAARSIAGPSQYDIRTNRVTIRTRTWDGDFVGAGNYTDSDLDLAPHYPIRYVTTQEIFSSGGAYETGDILVDHITPSDGGSVGYTKEQLHPQPTSDNVEIIHILTGTHAGEYRCLDVRTYRPFTFQLILRRRANTP